MEENSLDVRLMLQIGQFWSFKFLEWSLCVTRQLLQYLQSFCFFSFLKPHDVSFIQADGWFSAHHFKERMYCWEKNKAALLTILFQKF